MLCRRCLHWRCSMSAALVILPMVWATAVQEEMRAVVETVTQQQEAPELGFYRKYPEGRLRGYMRLSSGGGRAPSLVGREMFRGKVTNYRVHGFDDVVIFVHDVETCLAKLDQGQQYLIKRTALQEKTQQETAGGRGLG